MRRTPVAGLLAALVLAAPAQAETVLTLDGDRVMRREDRLLPRAALPEPRGAPATSRARAAGARRTVRGELRRLLEAGAIDAAEHDRRRAQYAAALATLRRLSGRRRVELRAVVRTLEGLAADGRLIASRVRPLFLTLERNRAWWAGGPLLSTGRRVTFRGSRLVWQYFAGQGLQLHPLANFGKANAFFSTGEHDVELRELLDELVPLAAERAGGLAWEYYFRFGRGHPPWVSGLAQGTAVQALSRAAVRLGNPDYFTPARAGTAAFAAPPPDGVRVGTPTGAHFLLYSFDPGLRVLNGFVQALVGLHDFAALANDEPARALFAAGETRARLEVPRGDTGAWSLYALGGRESDLSYHRLLRDFLQNLCERVRSDVARAASAAAPPPPWWKGEPVYCGAAERFTSYLRSPPQVAIRTRRATAGRVARIELRLSKVSSVTVRAGGRLLAGGVRRGRGRPRFSWRAPRRPGRYAVHVTAVDLAGNATSTSAFVRVTRPSRRARRG